MAQVVVGMSGGVDSAVAAYLLKKAGHQVTGVFMRNWDSLVNNDVLGNPNLNDTCPEEKDWADVVKIGEQLGIEVRRIDFVKEYWTHVFTDLIQQYQNGRTPNPDILCNKYVKFGVFYDWVSQNMPEVEYIATGHYAALTEDGLLIKPLDDTKDQTYFLAQVGREKLRKTLFPLAQYTKKVVREIATAQNLIVANKKDSTGICFIGERDFTQFLQNYIPAQPGAIVDITSRQIIGQHQGAMYYTIGKRSGIGLSGMTEPYYVIGHNLQAREVYVAPQSQPSYLLSNSAIINDVNWFGERSSDGLIKVKFRYRSAEVNCTIEWLSNTSLRVNYPEGFLAVTPGQQAVFYQGEQCLGGGVIERVLLDGAEKPYLIN